jgi:hypothetical protein
MIIHAKDSPALRRQLIDANGKRWTGSDLILWCNLDTGEACRYQQNALGELLLDPVTKFPKRELIRIPSPVSCLPMGEVCCEREENR